MIFDADDFGCNHVISDMCQSHDCRDVLIKLKAINPNFKLTLFAIPGEMTQELLDWCKSNNDWIELAVHGFYHTSNYECEKMTYDEACEKMDFFADMLEDYFVKIFKAPGWQISEGTYQFLQDYNWWVADQGYNDERRPDDIRAYVNDNGNFRVWTPGTGFGAYLPATHHHTWDCVGNGVYEQFDYLSDLVKRTDNWQFVSEAMKGIK